VRYTVWSRGRLIGETDLGFAQLVEQSRSGWFHPNADGERLMPVVASVLPAMRAYLHRDAVDAQGNSLVHPEMYGSTTFADLAEAFHHLGTLDLELRREDGTVVPTSDIGIQDTHRLVELAELDDDDLDAATSQADGEPVDLAERDRQLDADVMHDLELIEQGFETSLDDLFPAWMPDHLQQPRFPRYQIHVLLADGASDAPPGA
jgi:hypothetical protein